MPNSCRPSLGDLILLVSPKGKRYLRKFDPAQPLHTSDGKLDTDKLAQASFGSFVPTHLGRKYLLHRPTLYDVVKNVKRQTQVIYPKDIGYIVMKLGIGPGLTVVEAGSGSGSMTVALAWFVGPQGKVYTHERREEFRKLNQRNLAWAGLDDGRVEHHDKDIEEGFACPPHAADALFLDVREPWLYAARIPEAVKPGAPLGFLLPTVNQVSDLLRELEAGPFTDIEVVELFARSYKPVADRLRPADRMVAHTGFLVFARHSAAWELRAAEAADATDATEAAGVAGETAEQSGAPAAAMAADDAIADHDPADLDAVDDARPDGIGDDEDADSCEC